MKLYTKEMFLKASKECEVSMIDAEHIMKHIDEYVIPIELPSDEKLEEVAERTYPISKRYKEVFGNNYDDFNVCFKEGAKWVIEQIKQQSDE